MKCSRAWNVREFREIARFVKFSCTWIFAPCSQLPVSFWIFQMGPLLREIWAKTYSNVMKSGLILLKMVRFSIRNHRWKAEDLSYLKIRENFMHANISCYTVFDPTFHIQNLPLIVIFSKLPVTPAIYDRWPAYISHYQSKMRNFEQNPTSLNGAPTAAIDVRVHYKSVKIAWQPQLLTSGCYPPVFLVLIP